MKHERIQLQNAEDTRNILNDWENDQVIQKTRVLANDNKQGQVEVVEYIRVPKELQVKKQVINPLNVREKMKKLRSFEERLLNQFEREQREKEKLYFLMYIKIKNRYKFHPEKLIKIYKLYFNKVPSFEKNLTADYDPETFLFNFEEFKEEFKEIIYRHQACGAMCIHLQRFYEKIHQFNHSDRELFDVKKTIIDKLPKLLTEDMNLSMNYEAKEEEVVKNE